MSSAADDDGQQRFALGLIFVLIALLVSTVVGVTVARSLNKGPADTGTGVVTAINGAIVTPAPTEPAALAPAAVVFNEQAVVRVDGEIVKFFFATGKAEVAEGAEAALAQVLQGVKDGKRVRISGFHDAVGDAAANEELAKRRAQAVQATLVRLGVEEARVELAKPAQTLASGSNAEARRVEVFLID